MDRSHFPGVATAERFGIGSRAGPNVRHWKDLHSLQQDLNGAVNMFSSLPPLRSKESVRWLETGAAFSKGNSLTLHNWASFVLNDQCHVFEGTPYEAAKAVDLIFCSPAGQSTRDATCRWHGYPHLYIWVARASSARHCRSSPLASACPVGLLGWVWDKEGPSPILVSTLERGLSEMMHTGETVVIINHQSIECRHWSAQSIPNQLCGFPEALPMQPKSLSANCQMNFVVGHTAWVPACHVQQWTQLRKGIRSLGLTLPFAANASVGRS